MPARVQVRDNCDRVPLVLLVERLRHEVRRGVSRLRSLCSIAVGTVSLGCVSLHSSRSQQCGRQRMALMLRAHDHSSLIVVRSNSLSDRRRRADMHLVRSRGCATGRVLLRGLHRPLRGDGSRRSERRTSVRDQPPLRSNMPIPWFVAVPCCLRAAVRRNSMCTGHRHRSIQGWGQAGDVAG